MSSQLDGYVLIFKVEVGEPEAKKDSVVDKQVRLGQDSGGRVGPEAGRHGSHEELRDHGYGDQADHSIFGDDKPLEQRGPLDVPEKCFTDHKKTDEPAEEPEEPEVVKNRSEDQVNGLIVFVPSCFKAI